MEVSKLQAIAELYGKEAVQRGDELYFIDASIDMSTYKYDFEKTAQENRINEIPLSVQELEAVEAKYQELLTQAEIIDHNADIKKQIETLESKALRPARSIARATVNGTEPDSNDIAKLNEYDDAIIALRDQLVIEHTAS